MPYQPFNYANIPAQGAPWMNDFVENLAKGYKAGNLPEELKRQAEKENTANQMAALLLQEEPEKFGADLAGKKISNAMAQLLYQQQPEKFRAEMGSTSSQNSARQAQVRLAELQYDPAKYAAYINGLRTELSKSMGQANPAPQQQMPGELSNQTPIAWGEGNTPMANAPQQMEAPQPNPSSFNNEDFINSLIRKQAGLSEVPAETPQQKNDRALNLFKEKQAAKLSGEVPTNAFITANQNAVQAIDNVIPLLKNLKESVIPSQTLGLARFTDPDAQAAYNSQVAGISDSLVTAMKLPKTNESLELVKTMVGREPRESEGAYLKRIDKVIKDLGERRKQSLSSIKKPLSESSSGSSSPVLRYNPETGRFE